MKNNAKATLKVTSDATEEDNLDDPVAILAKAVKAQFANVRCNKGSYNNKIFKSIADEYVSDALLGHLHKLSPSLHPDSLMCLLIGNMVAGVLRSCGIT